MKRVLGIGAMAVFAVAGVLMATGVVGATAGSPMSAERAPDTTLPLSGSLNGTFRGATTLGEAISGKFTWTNLGHSDVVPGVGFSIRGNMTAAAGDSDENRATVKIDVLENGAAPNTVSAFSGFVIDGKSFSGTAVAGPALAADCPLGGVTIVLKADVVDDESFDASVALTFCDPSMLVDLS